MNGLFVFGLILLVMILIIYPKLQKIPESQCPHEIKCVKDNKKYFIIFLVVSILMILGGLVMMIT